MSAYMSTREDVVLWCNGPSCGRTFTAASTSAEGTRAAAARTGWEADGDRRDYCPRHTLAPAG